MKSVSLDCKVWPFWAIWANLDQILGHFFGQQMKSKYAH